MSSMDLIQQLAKDCQPVKRQFSPLKFSLLLCVGSFLLIAFFVAFSVRKDLALKFSQMDYIFSLALLLGQAVFGWLAVSTLSNPGRRGLNFAQKLSIGVSILSLLLLLAKLCYQDSAALTAGVDSSGMTCSNLTLIQSLVCIFSVITLTRGRLSLKPWLTAFMISWASLACGIFGISLICSSENAMHILLYHAAVPVLVACTIGVYFGRRALRF